MMSNSLWGLAYYTGLTMANFVWFLNSLFDADVSDMTFSAFFFAVILLSIAVYKSDNKNKGDRR